MNETGISSAEVLAYMAGGAELYRSFGENAELRIPDKTALPVPIEVFDELVGGLKIRPRGETGYYDLA